VGRKREAMVFFLERNANSSSAASHALYGGQIFITADDPHPRHHLQIVGFSGFFDRLNVAAQPPAKPVGCSGGLDTVSHPRTLRTLRC
jgi:hypothetical protein